MLIKIACTGCGKALTVNVKLEEKLAKLQKEIDELTKIKDYYKKEYELLKYKPKSGDFGDMFSDLFKGGRG